MHAQHHANIVKCMHTPTCIHMCLHSCAIFLLSVCVLPIEGLTAQEVHAISWDAIGSSSHASAFRRASAFRPKEARQTNHNRQIQESQAAQEDPEVQADPDQEVQESQGSQDPADQADQEKAYKEVVQFGNNCL